jgi:hypothetical protein
LVAVGELGLLATGLGGTKGESGFAGSVCAGFVAAGRAAAGATAGFVGGTLLALG